MALVNNPYIIVYIKLLDLFSIFIHAHFCNKLS